MQKYPIVIQPDFWCFDVLFNFLFTEKHFMWWGEILTDVSFDERKKITKRLLQQPAGWVDVILKHNVAHYSVVQQARSSSSWLCTFASCQGISDDCNITKINFLQNKNSSEVLKWIWSDSEREFLEDHSLTDSIFVKQNIFQKQLFGTSFHISKRRETFM